MSNNSYPCRAGGEIGRAQVAQAEACGLEPEPAMNPILLKPSGNGTSQVVVNGRVWKTLSAREYYAHADELRAKVLDAYDDLASRFDVDRHRRRRQRDRAEPARARSRQPRPRHAGFGAPWLLVADIERGGVFGSVIGTTHLLTPTSARCFAASPSTSSAATCRSSTRACGSSKSERRRAASACFPYAADVHLDAEDSLALETRPRTPAPPGARTRDRPLAAPVERDRLPSADVGGLDYGAADRTATTSSSCPAARTPLPISRGSAQVGLADWIVDAASARRDGHRHLRRLSDARTHDRRSDRHRVVGRRSAEGWGCFRRDTMLTREKRTRAVARDHAGGVRFGGYEIHLGVTTLDRRRRCAPFARLDDGSVDGVRGAGVIGTYLHGAFEHPEVCAEVFGIDAPSAASKAGPLCSGWRRGSSSTGAISTELGLD